jgi:hypothetical protein
VFAQEDTDGEPIPTLTIAAAAGGEELATTYVVVRHFGIEHVASNYLATITTLTPGAAVGMVRSLIRIESG